VELDVIEYLNAPPSEKTLRALIRKLGLEPKDLVRSGETEFKDAGVDLQTASEEQIVALMAACPKLIQRPIVVVDQTARIGRPPEAVLELFE